MKTPRLLALLALLWLAALVVSSCGGGGTSGTTPSGSGEVFVQSAGEIFLEPAGEAGPESFAGDALVFDHAVPSPTSLSILTTLPTLPGSPVQVASYGGGTPGLYGGSRSKLIADKDAQLAFLQANLDKATAWVAALNADPTLRWSGGTTLTVEQLADYFAELTPVLLTRDVRVTNHGFKNGRPTPRQSILQAGQYVLVDIFGVPRARCECGNPLIPPIAVATEPRYTGTPWSGFDPSTVILVQAAAERIESLVLIDPETGQTFQRAIGSSGDKDADRTTTTPLPPTTSTSMVTTTTTLAAESFDGTYVGKTIWYWNESGTEEGVPESEAVVKILDGLVTGSVKQVTISHIYSSEEGATVRMRHYWTFVFTGNIDDAGTFRGEGTSSVVHERISFDPENAVRVRPAAGAALTTSITVIGEVSGNSLEGQIQWDGETYFKFDGVRL